MTNQKSVDRFVAKHKTFGVLPRCLQLLVSPTITYHQGLAGGRKSVDQPHGTENSRGTDTPHDNR